MKKRTFTPISVLIGVLLLALAAAMTTFVADSDIAFAQSANADLTNIIVNYDSDGDNQYNDGPADLSPTFAAGTTSYTAKPSNSQGIPSEVNKLYISATLSDSDATIDGKTDMDTSEEGIQFLSQTLTKGGKTTVNITVRAANGSTKTYSVTVYRLRSTPKKNANLSSLSLSSGSLTPGFSSSQIEYNARVANSVDEVTVSYTPSDNAGGVSVDVGTRGANQTCANNFTDAPDDKVSLTAGEDKYVCVRVLPETGADADRKTYEITVYRLNTNLKIDADLSGLAVTPSTSFAPSFGSAITSYTAVAANGTSQVTIAATKKAGQMVSISPADADGGASGHQINLGVASTVTVTVRVTAEDTSISKTYTVKVYRQRATLSEVSTLDALSLSVGSLSPSFNKDTLTGYTARVGSNISKVTVNATPTDNAGGVGIAVTQSGGASVSGREVTLGSPGSTTTITVTVTPENTNATQSQYVVNVYRKRSALLGQANLGELSLALIGDQAAIADNNNVSLADEDFTARVNNETTHVTVTANPSDSTGATRVITPADSITTGANAAGHQVALTAGATTTITITVTAEDGVETKTYTVEVYRQGATLSDVNTLSALSISPGSLSPAFTTAGVDYKARVANSVEKVTVSATPTDNSGGATVAVGTRTTASTDCNANFTSASDNEVDLAAGSNTIICVRVNSEAGTGETNRKNYEISVYRGRLNPSDDATLRTFTIAEATGTITDLNGDNTADSPLSVLTDKKPDVVYRVREVTVDAEGDIGAIVTITPDDADASRPGHQVALAEGEVTDITVTVQPEDTTVDAKTYSASVYRKNASTRESDDATLKSLTLSGAVLTPEFDPATTSYTADAAFSATKTIVTAMPNHIGARNGVVIAPGATSKSGWEVPLSAAGGKYTITITVTPETGASADAKTYTVEVTRAATAGTDATLSSLSLTDGAGMDIALTPAFDADTAAYTASVDSTVTAANVMAMAAAPGTTVEVMYGADDMEVTAGDDGSYSVPLTEGANTVKVMVTAEDAETTMTYTVTVTVSPADPSIALYDKYDTNDNNMIDKSEVVAAIEAYLEHGTLTKAEVVTLIQKYLSGEPIRE